MKINNPKAGFRSMTFEKSLQMFDPSYKKPDLNQKTIDLLRELAKYRLLSKTEIEEFKNLLINSGLDSHSYTMGWSDGGQSREYEIQTLRKALWAMIDEYDAVKEKLPAYYQALDALNNNTNIGQKNE